MRYKIDSKAVVVFHCTEDASKKEKDLAWISLKIKPTLIHGKYVRAQPLGSGSLEFKSWCYPSSTRLLRELLNLSESPFSFP